MADRQRIVTGFHGTILDHGLEMAAGRFVPSNRKTRWLGAGLYFFEENFDLAHRWAERRAARSGKAPAVLRADIDLSKCFDLTRTVWQSVMRNAYLYLESEWTNNPSNPRPQQLGLEIHKGQVRSGHNGEWENYGRNELDFCVVEQAIKIAKEQFNIPFDSVRGVFPEGGELYTHSWLYEDAHVAIAVRSPELRLSNLSCLKIN